MSGNELAVSQFSSVSASCRIGPTLGSGVNEEYGASNTLNGPRARAYLPNGSLATVGIASP